jgi:hypothetical protein
MHFGLEYDHKLKKQYNTQFTRSLIKIPDVFGMYVVEQPITCNDSSPAVPLHPACHTNHPMAIFSSAVISNCGTAST